MKSGQLPFKVHFLTDDVLHFLKNISLYFKNFGCIIFRNVDENVHLQAISLFKWNT